MKMMLATSAMNLSQQLKRSLGAFALLLFLVVPAVSFAQQTTSSIQGTVKDGSGNPVGGAQIVVEHVSTGITSRTSSNATGSYSLRGLRVGGPYVATLTGTDQFGEERIEEIYISLTEPYVLHLVTRTTEIEEIIVSASQQDAFIRMGAASNFDLENIDGQANINRDFKNVIQQDPRVMIDYTNQNAISIAGTNNRFNSLTVDGVRQNDDFGLNNSGFPTQRAPISIDAIEQISVEIAPFDVTYGSFIGGTINAVTRSGTNDWDGTITYQFSNDSLLGDKSKNDTVDLGKFDEDYLAATFSGPIIKDRLWFFVSYEEFTGTDTSTLDFGPAGSGKPNEIAEVTQADLNTIRTLADSVYGFEAGQLPSSGQDITSETLLVKLDWAINDNHKVTATYQDVLGNNIVPQGSSSFSSRIGLPSNWYDRSEDFQAISAQMFSNWTDAFSTEIKIASQERKTGQDSLFGSDMAQMEIVTAGGGSVRIGSDEFRHGNQLANDQLQLKIKADLLVGSHGLTFGVERDNLEIFNLFNPASNGIYEFDCINTLLTDPVDGCANSFEGRQAAVLDDYSNAFTNVKNDAAATFDYQVNSAYVQDTWDVNSQLTLQYGIRYDWYTSSDKPALNSSFVTRNGFSNQSTLDGRDVIMPRFGFTYDLASSPTTLRGGVGLFSGGNPNVWISNSFSNDGVTIVVPDDSGSIDPTCAGVMSSVAALTNVDAFNVAQEVQNCMFQGAGDVEFTDPGFDIPSVWKLNIAVDHEFDFGRLGDGWFFTAEAIFTEVNNATEWRDLARTQIGSAAADGRPIYDTPPVYDVMLTNTSEGFQRTYSLSLAKAWETRAGDFGAQIHYTYMDAEDVNPSQSSTVSSNFGRPATLDRNGRTLRPSDFLVEHRFNGSIDWQKNLFGENATRVNMFWEFRSGKPFSYTMRETSDTGVWGGDRTFARRDSQLLYVPTIGDPNVIFATTSNNPGATVNDPAVEADFNAFVAAAGLEGFRGQIVPRNHDETDWRSRINLRIQQDIGLFDIPGLGQSKLRLFLDVENLGNLLNDDWGRIDQVFFPFNFTAVDEVSINANGDYVYSSFDDFADGINPESFQSEQSIYKIQLGITLQF